jgi:DNA gyrase/topoisomerase IV subunit A
MLEKTWNNFPIRIRQSDRYVCITDMAKACGKLYGNWRKLQQAQRYLEALSRSILIGIDQLIQVIDTGLNETRGTWAHPKVALRFAQWCSPEFAVQVDIWIDELLTTGSVSRINTNRVLSRGELLQLQAEAIIDLERKQQQLEQKTEQITEEISELKKGIKSLSRLLQEDNTVLGQTVRQKLVELMQTLGGILITSGEEDGYARIWKELGLAMRNSEYKYDLNSRYASAKKTYMQNLKTWEEKGKPRGLQPKKQSRPDILEQDNMLNAGFEAAKELTRRYIGSLKSK